MNSHNCQNVFIALLADNIASSYNSEQIEDLVFVSQIGNKNMLKEKLKEVVPTYSSPEQYNLKALDEAAITIGGDNNA